MTCIYELRDDGKMSRVAEYTLPAKKALVCYIRQHLNNDYSWWNYPEEIQGMRQSEFKSSVWEYDDGKTALTAYEG